MEVLRARARGRFEGRMLSYLLTVWPAACERLGTDVVRQTIHAGTDKAANYDIRSEYGVGHYIEMMLTLSPDFDVSHQTPWAAGILNDPKLGGNEKIEMLRSQI